MPECLAPIGKGISLWRRMTRVLGERGYEGRHSIRMSGMRPDDLPPAIVSWSGGKDCSLAHWRARELYDVRALLTTVTEAFDRISMHGVRGELLRRQAKSLGVELV